MVKKLTFETNGEEFLEFVSGEYIIVYFILKYENAPEYFAHSLSEPAIVKFLNTNKQLTTFNGQLVSYFPAAFVLVLTPEQTSTLLVGDKMNMEIEVKDIYEQLHIAQRPASLTVRKKLVA